MATAGIDALVVSVGSDLPYLTGYTAIANERLTMAVVRDDLVALFVPRLEEPRVERRGDDVEVIPWDETDDPLDLIVSRLNGADTVAVGAQTWARFVLGLQDKLRRGRFVDATRLMSGLRVVKDPLELEMLARAATAADRVAHRLGDVQFSGRTERSLSHFIARETVAEGHDTANFAIVASGPNAASPHHEPGNRVIARGDSVVVDFGGSVSGYGSDISRTFHVGEPPAEVAAAYDVLHAAQEAGVEAARAGVPAESVDAAARSVIERGGFGAHFIHRTGHGIGLDGHEDPYLVEGNATPLEVGMAFSVEPGIYVSGRFGMRIEDIVVLGAGGAQRLNLADRDLVVVS